MSKSSGSSSSTTTWKPNQYQSQILQSMVDSYKNDYLPMSNGLSNIADSLYGGLASQTIDYNGLLNNAYGQVASGQEGIANLANGKMPDEYMKNIQDGLQMTTNNLVGTAINNLGNKGVINSTVANNALNDISANVANTVAQKQSDYMSQLADLYNNQISNAGTQIGLAGTAQGNAQGAASNVLTDSLNAYNAASGLLGTGGTQTSSNNSGSSNLVNGLLGLGSAFVLCFAGDTIVMTPDGEKEIKDVKVGDKVMCLDDYHNTVYQTVSEVQEPIEQEAYEVVTDCGSVKTTLSQPLMVEDGTFVDVGLMKLKTKLMFKGEVQEFIKLGKILVYDLKVDGYNNYLANGFVAYGMLNKE